MASSSMIQPGGGGDLPDRRLLYWMFSFLRPVRARVVLACLYLGLGIAAEILAVRQTAEAINRIELVRVGPVSVTQSFRLWLGGESAEAAGLEHAIVLLAGLTLAVAILTYLREVADTKLSMHKVFYIREAVYDKLQRVGVGFHDRLSTGELINRALSDLQNVRGFISSSVLLAMEILLIVGGYIVLLLTRAPSAALIALVPLPLWLWYTARFSRRLRPAQEAVMDAADTNVSLITENIAGVHVVRAFATEAYEIEKYNRHCDEFFGKVKSRIRAYASFSPVIRGISMSAHLLLFLLAGILMVKRVLAPGDILLLGSAMAAILSRLQQVASINEQYQNALVSARRLREVLAAEPATVEPSDARPLPPGRGAVRFEGVTFGYDPSRPVLHEITFEVPAGKMAAIVGPTGSGKTTLVQLLGRLYEPQRGRIRIDGIDIREISLESLRSQVAIVAQEAFLFSDSIEANIAYARPHVRTEEIEAVSRLAQSHEFVDSLPQGYGAILGERGATLSGGQRQRLAIARAFFANPRILILDDATAAVDPETEELVFGGVRFVMRDRTTFVISNRLKTVRRADIVIVLDKGRVAQMGTHDQLMRDDGHYREIAAAQLHADEYFDAGPPSHLDRAVEEREVRAAKAAAEAGEGARREAEP
jgi:ATP-binding cassette subfamily B protein